VTWSLACTSRLLVSQESRFRASLALRQFCARRSVNSRSDSVERRCTRSALPMEATPMISRPSVNQTVDMSRDVSRDVSPPQVTASRNGTNGECHGAKFLHATKTWNEAWNGTWNETWNETPVEAPTSNLVMGDRASSAILSRLHRCAEELA
jgi:hypothetical protein